MSDEKDLIFKGSLTSEIFPSCSAGDRQQIGRIVEETLRVEKKREQWEETGEEKEIEKNEKARKVVEEYL